MKFVKVIWGPKCHWFQGSQDLPVVVQGLFFLHWDNERSSQQNQGSFGWLETTAVGNRSRTGCKSLLLVDPHFQHFPSKVCGFTDPYFRPFCTQHVCTMPSHEETQGGGFLGSILSMWANKKPPLFKRNLNNCRIACGPKWPVGTREEPSSRNGFPQAKSFTGRATSYHRV